VRSLEAPGAWRQCLQLTRLMYIDGASSRPRPDKSRPIDVGSVQGAAMYRVFVGHRSRAYRSSLVFREKCRKLTCSAVSSSAVGATRNHSCCNASSTPRRIPGFCCRQCSCSE
jgi:hypothetical protein